MAFTQFEIPEQADIVDIGCGGGFNIQRMLSKCKTGKIYGIDISEESVKKAKKVNRDELEKRVRMMGLSFLLFPMILNLSHIPVQNYLILMKDKPGG